MSNELKGTANVKNLTAKLQKADYSESFQLGNAERATETISTGSLILDLATGIGGYPRGRITQLRGWESAGKTTHALKAIANLQEKGGSAAFIDTEYALDPVWAQQLGVDMESLLWIQVDDLETAGEIAVDLAESNSVDMVIFDSVAGAPIKAVVEGELGDANMGKRAKIMSDMMPKLNGPVARNDVWMIFINQLRESLNMYSPRPVSPGGHALAFHSSLIIDFKGKKIKEKNEVARTEITATIEKNKLSPPGKVAIYTMDVGGYIDLVSELADILTSPSYADALDVVRAGSWYTLPQEALPGVSELKFQGKKELALTLAEVDVFEGARDYVTKRLQ